MGDWCHGASPGRQLALITASLPNLVCYFRRCESVLAAAAFSFEVEPGSLNTAEALEAALFPVVSFSLRYCVRALAAADLSLEMDFGSASTFAACVATLLLVSLDVILSSRH